MNIDALLHDLAVKAAWQDNSGPRTSATTESTNVGFDHKDDLYDRGPKAWENSGKYLKHGAKHDHRVPSSSGVKLASAQRVAKQLVKTARVKQAGVKVSFDLRGFAAKLGAGIGDKLKNNFVTQQWHDNPATTTPIIGGLLGGGLGAAGGYAMSDDEHKGRGTLVGGMLGAGAGIGVGGIAGLARSANMYPENLTETSYKPQYRYTPRGSTTMEPPSGRGALLPGPNFGGDPEAPLKPM